MALSALSVCDTGPEHGFVRDALRRRVSEWLAAYGTMHPICSCRYSQY